MWLNMLIEFGDAFDFTGADFAAWCKEAGFREIDVLPLAGPTSAGIAYKQLGIAAAWAGRSPSSWMSDSMSGALTGSAH